MAAEWWSTENCNAQALANTTWAFATAGFPIAHRCRPSQPSGTLTISLWRTSPTQPSGSTGSNAPTECRVEGQTTGDAQRTIHVLDVLQRVASAVCQALGYRSRGGAEALEPSPKRRSVPMEAGSLNQWPVAFIDAEGKPPPHEQVRVNEGKFTWYDWRSDISNIENLANNEWANSALQSAQDMVRIALAGKAKSGKTWLLHQMASLDLLGTDKEGNSTEVLCTPSLCCKRLKFDGKICSFIDSKGEQSPNDDVSESRFTNQSSEYLFVDHAFGIADVLIYIVNQVGEFEHCMKMNLVDKQRAHNFSFTIIVVHNLIHVFNLEGFDKAKYEICARCVTHGLFLKQFGDVDVLLGPSAANSSNPTQIHVFLGQQCRELKRGNEQTIRFLRKNLACLPLCRGRDIHSDLRHARNCNIHDSDVSSPTRAVPEPAYAGCRVIENQDGSVRVEIDTPATRAVPEAAYAGCRVIENQDGSVRVEIDAPADSKKQTKIDLAQAGAHDFLKVNKLKSSAGVDITVGPRMQADGIPKDKLGVGQTSLPNVATITIQKQVALSSSVADYRHGTMLLTFLPKKS